jgi:16S rRNA (adenine1518-N6/adenine1519-N6)-dimethyltransferase
MPKTATGDKQPRANPTQSRARKSLGLKPAAKRPVRPTRRKAARLGQHFLMHPQIAERIAEAARLSPEDTVFEIGPGRGMLTYSLLSRVEKVVAIEADPELYAQLRQQFAKEIEFGKFMLIEGDVRALNTATLPQGYKVVANIPYYITGEILRLFLEAPHQPAQMTLLVQKEVARRVARDKKESILSLSVKAYGSPKYEFTVPKGAFKPMPKVDSALLSVRGISREKFENVAQEKHFFTLLHAGFGHKRKKLAGNLKSFKLHLPPILIDSRAEDLTLAAWLELAKQMK